MNKFKNLEITYHNKMTDQYIIKTNSVGYMHTTLLKNGFSPVSHYELSEGQTFVYEYTKNDQLEYYSITYPYNEVTDTTWITLNKHDNLSETMDYYNELERSC